MASPKRILALNLGMQTITLADFRQGENGGIVLHACKQEELIVDPAADATRPAQIESAVSTLRAALGVKPGELVTFSLPSQSVFTRFVKLPGSGPDDVTAIIAFEAQQNVPFPIDEVVWDYQIMGAPRNNSWDVSLVAIKADQLTEINSAVNKGGLRTHIIDVAPFAIYNAYRYNYSDLSGCSLLVDIGARTTNLLFVEDQKVFSRSIPVGGNAISAAIARDFKQDVTVGERLKIDKGFVGLGGAYAERDDPTEARVAKIIRNTMTRLHAEIARSISFYRQNQNGSAPVRAFLCGGTVSLPYMVEFFSEKLQTPIEYLNPFRNVVIADEDTGAFVSSKAHVLGEVVGCALRMSGGTCPVELNLRPPSVVREQDLAKRRPFLLLTSICLLLGLGSLWFLFNRSAALTSEMLDKVKADVAKLDGVANQFAALDAENQRLQAAAAPLVLASVERSAWHEIIDELAAKLPPRFIWVTGLQPLVGGKPFGPDTSGRIAAPSPPPSGPPRPGQRPAETAESKIDAIQISGLYLANPPNDKETRIIDEFVEQLRKSDAFLLEGKRNEEVITQRTTQDGRSWAYGYSITLPLRHPISLP